MAIITDATGRQLAQAVGGIDTGGLAKDTTLQATNTALGNMNATQQSIVSAISGLGAMLGRKIIIDTVQYTTTQTLSSQVDYIFTFDVSKTGYTPLGIVGITKSGSYNTRFNQNKWFISGNNVSITLRCSETGVSANGIIIDVTILYSQL